MKLNSKKAKRTAWVLAAVLVVAVGCTAALCACFPELLPSHQSAQTYSKLPATVSAASSATTSSTRATETESASSSERSSSATTAPKRPSFSETTSFQITPVNKSLYLSADTVVRASPSIKAEKLGTATKNSYMQVSGSCSNGWMQIMYKNKVGYVPSSNLTAKEPALQTSSPYLLCVNRTQNLVTVYKKDSAGQYTVPYRAMVCSVGLSGNTPCGTFATTDRYAWRLLEGNVYGQYATRITGHILFHSVPYYTKNKGDLESAEYNKLGSAASLGCVRLSVADAKWIYDHCPKNTAVVIYDSSAAEPLEKPVPVKIDLKDRRSGWDPTDPDPANPWKTSETQSTAQSTTASKSE